MKIYFLSAMPCALTLNGVFFGVTDTFERFAEIDLRDRVFVQFSPQGCLPVGFFLTEEIRFQPPPACEVYLLRDGIAIYAQDFIPTDNTLRTIAQSRDGDCLVTVYAQGRVQMAVNTPDGFFNAYLPPSFSNCSVEFHQELLFLRSETQLAVYTKRAELCLCERVLSYAVEENKLSARLLLSDSLGRVADCVWELRETGCTQTQFTLRALERANPPCQTAAELLPYAFFESALLGADFATLLSDELAPDAEKLRAFLGDFVAVTLTQDPNVCGLVRKKEERLFELAYFTVEIQDGKITDVQTAN